jgi:Zn finger protein HypA/HybF involved in hydrogenase expression
VTTEYDNDLLREGVLHYNVKEYDLARKYLERARANADDLQTRAQANYYLSLLTEDPILKRNYLEETLAIDMTHPKARRLLAILDGKLRPDDIVNPDSLPPQITGTLDVQAGRFICPKCGGRMVYVPDGVSLVCESCSYDQRLSSMPGSGEQDFFIAMADGSGLRSPVAVQTFRCQGCGSVFILAPDQLSASCACCGSAHVVVLDEKRQMVEPDSLLSMTLDQQQAARQLVHWMKEMRIAPQVPAPRGLYLPVWSFAIRGRIPWTGMDYRDKRQVPISGEKDIDFDDVRILGSRKWAGLMAQVLPEFDLSNATAYDSRFLAGWMADVYDLPMAEASLEARRIAVEHIGASIRQEFGTVRNLGYSSSSLMVNAFKLVLVPVWVTEIRTGDRSVRVLINGRNGSVHSEIPTGGLAGWFGNIFGGQ